MFILQGYEGNFHPAVESRIYRFLLREGRWDSVITTLAETSCAVSGACCCVLGDRDREFLATFGGWNDGERVADVHTLDLSRMAWKYCDIVNPEEGPFFKDKAGMIPYGNEMVCVVGGYGYPSPHHICDGVYRGQKGAQYFWDHYHDLCWTNEVHLFHFKTGQWIQPQISGQRPPPCAAFSLTMADSCRAVLFGGRQRERRVNHMYILHLDTWHWEGVLLQSSPNEPWPSARSFHTMCSLTEPSLVSPLSNRASRCHTPGHVSRIDWLPCAPPDLSPSHPLPLLHSRLLLLWGMDNSGDPVADCWMLELDPIMWKKVDIPTTELCCPRLWHVAGVCHPTPAEAEVVVFGGSKRNLFTERNHDVCSINDTVVLRYGVSTLYSSCVQYLSLMPDPVLALLPSLVPRHVVQQIEQQVTANRHYQHFTPIRL